jgi:histidine triad (HIT) family protein
MEGCIFCKIATNEIASLKIAEDEVHLAFLDINPLSPGHTLVMTKEHFEKFEEIPEERIVGFMSFLQRCVRAVGKGTGADGLNVLVNSGKAAGQLIPHAHFHIIPRFSGDPLQKAFNHNRGKYPAGKDKEYAEKIRGEYEKAK